MDNTEKLIKLIVEENVSALQLMEDELGLSHDEVVDLIGRAVAEGKVRGTLSEDEQRFWKAEVKLSDAPVIPREEKEPDFLNYDTRPGKIIAIIGLLILIAGGLILSFAADTTEQDFGTVITFVGVAVLLIGLYIVSRRDTPD
ncbi:MAG: hypothetical protein ACP6KW_12365 [Candidatus Thorarchaeota archaeon]